MRGKQKSSARWLACAATGAVHLAALAAALGAFNPTIVAKPKLGATKAVTLISLNLSPIQLTETVAVTQALALTPIIVNRAAGPVASSNASEQVSIAHRPRQLVNESVSQTLGAQSKARLMAGLLLEESWIPASTNSIVARIWIDQAGLATKVELLTAIESEEAEKLVISALMQALYLPAQKDGQTIDSVAELEFTRTETSLINSD